MTHNRLSSVRFCQDDITKIIQKLDPNKAHGHYKISIHILKICGSSIYKHLELVFKQCIETGVFPSEWKNGNIIPMHKKGDKQTVTQYRPVSLLPIYGNIPEKLLFNKIFIFFLENKVISSNQSCLNT